MIVVVEEALEELWLLRRLLPVLLPFNVTVVVEKTNAVSTLPLSMLVSATWHTKGLSHLTLSPERSRHRRVGR